LELKFALLADYVNVTREGKLNIIGEFDSLLAPRVPAVHPAFFLVARFAGHVSEGTDHDFTVEMRDEDGKSVLPKLPALKLPFRAQGPGRPLRGQIVFQMGGIRFPHYGRFEFHLLIDGRFMATVTVNVVKPPKRPEKK
jgi:hypothetical protein